MPCNRAIVQELRLGLTVKDLINGEMAGELDRAMKNVDPNAEVAYILSGTRHLRIRGLGGQVIMVPDRLELKNRRAEPLAKRIYDLLPALYGRAAQIKMFQLLKGQGSSVYKSDGRLQFDLPEMGITVDVFSDGTIRLQSDKRSSKNTFAEIVRALRANGENIVEGPVESHLHGQVANYEEVVV